MGEPLISDDGRWKWDGEEWIPIETESHSKDIIPNEANEGRFAICPKCSQMLKIPSEEGSKVSCPMCSEVFSPEISKTTKSAMETATKKRCRYFLPSGSRCRNEFFGPGQFCEEHATLMSQKWQASESEKGPVAGIPHESAQHRISQWTKFGLKAEDSAQNARAIFVFFIILNTIGGLVMVTDKGIKALGLTRFFLALVIIEIMFLILIYSMWNSIHLHLSLQNKIELENAMDSAIERIENDLS